MFVELNKYYELAERIKTDSDDMMSTYEAMSLAVDIITNDIRRESMFAIQEQNSLMRLIAKNNVQGQPGMQIEYGPGGVPKFL